MAHPVLIFGGDKGIGEALARRLHKAGGTVHIAARDEEALTKICGEVDAGHTVCDVGDEEQVKAAVQAACEDGALGGLVYAVGSIDVKPLKAAKADEFARAYALNMIGAAMAAKHAAPALKKGHGSIVLFTTVAAAQGFTNHTIIASAKGGVEGLMLALAAEMAPHVRVNAIGPTLTETPLAEAFTKNDQTKQALEKMHPIPRLGRPEDMAAMAAFLLSEDAGFITGQVMRVDGGRSTLRPRG